MSDNKNIHNPSEQGQSEIVDTNIAVSSSEVSSVAGSVKTTKMPQRVSSSSERQMKFERAQKCLENAALVSKRIKEHRKATAELLGRPFEEDDIGDTASEIASTMSERTSYSAATDTSTTLSVQDALNIPGISESLANTLKQKELLMERIKQYKEISKRPSVKSSTPLRRESTTDSQLDVRKSTDNNEQLLNTIKEKVNAISVMQVKMKALETTILDLQEKINEKDQIIEAKNKATSLMSDSLSKKEKDTLALLDDTKQQMTKMQENFVTMESEWKEEKQRLLKEVEVKEEKIHNLEEANTILENSRFEISIAHAKLLEELDLKNKEIMKLEGNIANFSKIDVDASNKEKDEEEEKGSLEIAGMVELTKKIELLEQLNCQIRQTNKELENKLAVIDTDSKSQAGSPNKKASPLTNRKGGRNTASKIKSPWSNLSSESLPQEVEKKPNKNELARMAMLVQSLNKDILEKEYIISQKDALIIDLQSANKQNKATISSIEMVDIGTCTDVVNESQPGTENEISDAIQSQPIDEHQSVDIKEFEEKLKEAQKQIALLNSDIEAANKNMIKVKSSNKLKLKQMQKTIDNFSKVSDANAEIVKLNEEIHQLSQKVAELEEEKGNLQLHLVDYDSGRLTESDVFKKLVEMENLAETRLKAISVLEAQKFDLVQELHNLQQKNIEMEDKLADISHIQNEQVCSEIKSVQLEEQIDALIASKKELELVIENIKLDKEQLNGSIKVLQEEKEELIYKLENYIQENIELTDKLEKLSAEKVSSAESIEIVESLTTQEKLELEEYNKGLDEEKVDDNHTENVSSESDKNIENLIDQSIELNKKIELFTQERQEVMDKMNKIVEENESLHEKIEGLRNQCSILKNDIEICNNEKTELIDLNHELSRQIEELKRERIEIMKEAAEIAKPAHEDTAEGVIVESQQDDKSTGDKGMNRTKSVKQLTKEILKLKNTIKEREAEIADCQMKILSLEEQEQKQNEMLQSNASNENRVKCLIVENQQLKDELDLLKMDKESEQQILHFQQAQELLQQEIQKIHQEYSTTITTRDARINELENHLVEYEKQILDYGNTLQQKDKDMNEYINQITKLNDVSQKLKSTIDLLEEEKAKNQNAELVKSLNKQIVVYQKKIAEYEEKLRLLEEDKVQLLSLKNALENENISLDKELKRLQEVLAEKQGLIKELQIQQQKHSEEISSVMLQTKERDEEIHEIKLQLRKESIENEKLRTNLTQKDKTLDELTQQYQEATNKMDNLSLEKNNLNEQFLAMESKNKELMEKLKKFAINIKKKSLMYAELETQHNETTKQLEAKNEQLEQLIIQVETLPTLQEKLKYAEEEINRLQSQKLTLEQQKSQDINQLQVQTKSLEDKLTLSLQEITRLNDSLNLLQKELNITHEENMNLKAQIEGLNNKIVEHEIEQKNYMNLITKISGLELDINQKQNHITELLNRLQSQEQQETQIQFGYDAKIQERDLYIENLESEINKYKSRICRLEESISVMEDRRHSLERKADQLDNQLEEKQKAYTEYTSQEDELVSRLAVLMDHDRVVEKQLYEIEGENKELQHKIQQVSEDNQRLRRSLSDIQEYCNTLTDKASKADLGDSEINRYQSQLRDVEAHLKRVTHEHQTLLVQKKQEIEDLESEFNTQIENAIKEKKALGEKHEKISEYVQQLELKLQEYRSHNENLQLNLEELNRINQELIEKSNKDDSVSRDYTDQYISEINNLNAVINNKNLEIEDLNNRVQTISTNNVAIVANLESKISELTDRAVHLSEKIEQIVAETNMLRKSNEQLKMLLSQKEEQIKELMDKNKLTFEMNIPKTEGMIISSTIEALNEESKQFDISYLESQIISDVDHSPSKTKKEDPPKTTELMQKESIDNVASTPMIESIIVPKKTYLCYQGDSQATEGDDNPESDPFNSDEGWGLGENEEMGDVTPGLSRLNEQIQQLMKDKETLKGELDTNNLKLLKALKKMKELKSANELLSNELKIAKQMPQSSFLDAAIEDELRLNIEALEKKVAELISDINKEKREKELLRKQNEVFNNASDRLTEVKEKLENEIELWKYKFKEANDKVSTLQWGADTKDSPIHAVQLSSDTNVSDNQLKDELLKIEKENDELQLMIDQLTSQNKELLSQQAQLKEEIHTLTKQLCQQQLSCENCENLKVQILDLQESNTQLLSSKNILNEKLLDIEIRYNEVLQNFEKLKANSESIQKELENENKELSEKYIKLEKEIEPLKCSELETSNIKSELENVKAKLLWYEEQHATDKNQGENISKLTQQCGAMEEQYLQLKCELQDANNKILLLESTNQDLLQKSNNYSEQINELNTKLQNLNTENDSLLSTVAELRSSVSSAVDQRGFEIAELWKQHLAQREADFQKTELELRNQLGVSEAKYEQLLDNVQSSSQEETNKLVVMEQVNSLQNKLQDKEEHLRNLQDKYAEVINQLDMLRSEMQDENVTHENKLFEQQEEYEKLIQELSVKNKELTEAYEKTLTSIQTELAESKSNSVELNQQIENLHTKINDNEVKVLELTNQLRLKDSEIYQKTHEYTITLSQRNEEFENVRKQLIEYEKKIEDLNYEKESELAVLRLKMHENGNHFEKMQNEFEIEKSSLAEALNAKITECTNLNRQISDLNRTLEEYSNKVTEMKTALENQEIEIVTLKDEISNLQMMLRSSSSKIQKHVSFASDTKQGKYGEKTDSALNKELFDSVPRAELDLALYMLHQRDVRCEELTMELTRLLEERDTLQLRLSDSLRSNEELKAKCKSAGVDESMNSSQETISELPSFTVEKEHQFVDIHRGQTSRSSSISDPDGDKPKLQAKLSELRTVRHSRDVWLRHESEQRQLDLRLLQRDVANLPPEAVDQLTQAHHTLSRDSQSTSTVLLNWLRGKSTPKVVHM